MKKLRFGGADWLQCKGTFQVMCSREKVTVLLTVSQKGGISIL